MAGQFERYLCCAYHTAARVLAGMLHVLIRTAQTPTGHADHLSVFLQASMCQEVVLQKPRKLGFYSSSCSSLGLSVVARLSLKWPSTISCVKVSAITLPYADLSVQLSSLLRPLLGGACCTPYHQTGPVESSYRIHVSCCLY